MLSRGYGIDLRKAQGMPVRGVICKKCLKEEKFLCKYKKL